MWKSLINNSRKKDFLYIVRSYMNLEACGYCGKEEDPEAICYKCFPKNKEIGFQSKIRATFWSLLRQFGRKNKFLTIRSELKVINKEIKRATYEMDAAYIEELMDEKYRLIDSV
ncbi:hypothetical protein ACFVAD_20270 [Sutcliffiella sp. NPDC057660]|uniref:hypothetical protein n=1 Tax=Sutcliffiella sp. NPDC057660 TaxID=3346199 RepID=UPI0036CF9281